MLAESTKTALAYFWSAGTLDIGVFLVGWLGYRGCVIQTHTGQPVIPIIYMKWLQELTMTKGMYSVEVVWYSCLIPVNGLQIEYLCLE